MAKVFEDKDGNIGTMVVLKGRPEDYLPEDGIYHGELELPEDVEHRSAWKHEDGAIVEDVTKVRDIRKAKLKVLCEEFREELMKKFHASSLIIDNAERASTKRALRLKSTDLDMEETRIIDELNTKRATKTLKAVNLRINIDLE